MVGTRFGKPLIRGGAVLPRRSGIEVWRGLDGRAIVQPNTVSRHGTDAGVQTSTPDATGGTCWASLVPDGMENTLELGVPLTVDRGWGASRGAAH